MEAFLDFFETMPTWQKLVWVVICLSLSWILEGSIPLFNKDYRKLNHIGTNLIFLSMSMVLNVLFGIATVGIFAWTAANEFGLLYLVEWPVWLELLLAVMFLDFLAQWVAHYFLHKFKWMWKMHMVHHSDTMVDATTGTRHHPGDYALRECYALVAIVISGMPISYYIFYRITTILFTYITHANISLPKWLDKTLSYVFITPDIHKFHHHFERPWTDTNFGNIFSFWDRIFGTFVYEDPKDIQYGLDVTDGAKDRNISYQLGLPFNKDIPTDY
ncbi:MAG: sterol desaturase family protein [Bacteroidota bacterium]